MKKIVQLLTMLVVFTLCLGIQSVSAEDPETNWQLQLKGVDGDLVQGSYYYVEVWFVSTDNGDSGTANDGEQNLNRFGLDIDYDETRLESPAILYESYTDPNDPFVEIWDGGIVPTTIEEDTGYIRDVNGSEPLGSSGVFFPDDLNGKLATIRFTAKVTGSQTDILTWVDPDIDGLARIDEVTYNLDPLILWKDGTSLNGTYLQEYYRLHLGINAFGQDEFPQEVSEQTYFTGVASALQALRFLGPAYTWPTQQELYDAYNTGDVGDDFTAPALETLLNALTYNNSGSPFYRIYHFSDYNDSDEDTAIKRIIHWIDYDVPNAPDEPNAPAHVPLNGAYNWMTVRGFVSDIAPTVEGNVWSIPEDVTVYGLWLNDPNEDGMGYNIYMTGDAFKTAYETVDGGHRSVVEPPLDDEKIQKFEQALPDMKINYVKRKANKQLAQAIRSDMELTWDKKEVLAAKEELDETLLQPLAEDVFDQFKSLNWEDVIPEELMASPDFNSLYSETPFALPMTVLNEESATVYTLVLFGKERPRMIRKLYKAYAAVVVDEEGVFQEASWTTSGDTYLTERGALHLAKKALKENYFKELKIWKRLSGSRRWDVDIVFHPELSGSVFLPVFQVTSPFGPVVYVTQDGETQIEGDVDPELRKALRITAAKRIKKAVLEETTNKKEDFRQDALARLPVISVDVSEQDNTVGVRIDPEDAKKTKEIIERVAELYKEKTNADVVTVVHYVGGKIFSRSTH